jgi:hypothetical protein
MKKSYTLTKWQLENGKDQYLLGVVKIDPLLFLQLTTSELSDDSGEHIEWIIDTTQPFDIYDQAHKNDDTIFPYLKVKENGQIVAHEGKHRAYAAHLLNKDFYFFLLPYSPSNEMKEDILRGDRVKYIPKILINQIDKIFRTSDFEIFKEIMKKSNPKSKDIIECEACEKYPASVRWRKVLLCDHCLKIAEKEEKQMRGSSKEEWEEEDEEIEYNPKELKIGQQIEMEHTDDPAIALKIAKDHLRELPDYYSRLIKMEKDASVKIKNNPKKNKTNLLATASDSNGIIEMIAKYWCNKPENIYLEQFIEDAYLVYQISKNEKILMPQNIVKIVKGRFRFEALIPEK